MGKVEKRSSEKKQTRKTKSLKEKHYPCSYCSKTFSESGGRNHHMLLHSSARPFACHLCPHTCKTKKYLNKHMRVVHQPPSSLKCDYCDKMFHYQSTLNKHMLVHTNAKPYKCSECGKAFNSGYSLGVHVRIHKDQKPYQCQYCEYACRDGSTLRRHHARHLGIVERHDCEICGKRYSKKGVLQRHVAEVHLSAQLRTTPCGHCDKMFWSKRDADRHVRIVHKRQYATACEICGMKITCKYNMRQHLVSHVEARPYKCAFAGCGKRFKDAQTLKKHTIIHCPEKQFPCKVCGRRFTRLARLVKHKSQHLVRVKDVQCDLCGVFFYNKNYLVLHMRRKHSRHRGRFVCDLCAFVCGNKPGMIMHLRGHAGETYHKGAGRAVRARGRYVCDLCDAECCSKVGLIMHIRGHSSRQDKECFICRRKYKKDLWLRLHLKQAHKVNLAKGSPAIRTDIKVEPVDMDVAGSPEFELFEVEKEELLDELAFINHDTSQEYDEDADQNRNTCDNVTEHAAATEASHTEPSKDIPNDSNLQDKEATVSSTGNSNMEQNTKTNGHEKEHTQIKEVASDNDQCQMMTERAGVVEVSDGNNVYNSTDKSEEVPAENQQTIDCTEDTVVKDSDSVILKEKSKEIPLEDVHRKRDSNKHTEVLENPGVNNVDRDLQISNEISQENIEEKMDSNEYKEIEETPIVNNSKDIVISMKTKSESDKDKDSKVKAILNKAIEDKLISKKILIVNLDNILNKKQSNVNHIQPSTKSKNMEIDQKSDDDLTEDITNKHSEYSNTKSIRSDNETRKSNYKRPVKNTVKNISGNSSTDNHNSVKKVKTVARNNGITKTHSKNKKIIVDFNKNKNHLENSTTNNKRSEHSKIKFQNNKTSKKTSKSLSVNNDKDSTTKSSSKRKSLAQIREKILKKNRKVTRIEINSKDSPEQEIQNNVENSKVVATEDVTRSMTKKKKNSSGKHIDDFLLKNMVHQPKESTEDLVEVDEECQSLARDSVELLLQESRRQREMRLVEKTRLEYNDRIRRARDIRTEKVSIKYFDKSKEKFATKVEAKTDVDEHSINDAENNVISEEKIKDNSQDKSNDSNITTEDTTTNNCEKEDRNTNISEEEKDNTKTSEDKDTCEGLDKTSNETELLLVDKEFSKPDERDDNSNCEQKGETDRIKLRSSSGVVKKRCVDDKSNDGGNKKDVSDVRKIKLNTHQCYVCFKLFDTKDTLLDHCKDHFDVCNSTILKKCPLCDFATKLSIVQHMKTKHGVKITIPSTRIVGKESESGTGYCYKVKSSTIEDIDIIPSVKHLNKQAYIDIDKKRRKLKDTGIAKTKLVKKGNEWIVERKTTKIDNVEDYILPEFDVDEILAVKIVSNDYLTRMKKLHRLAKKYKREMLFPCEHCEKICLNMAALKLHYRRHEPGAKPFKKKIWKHKMVDKVETKKKVKRNNAPVKEIDRIEKAEERTNDNRYKKPKPVVNKHKCDPELIKFYETNIKGGDIEFWQFLKIFNKMSRENVNDFEDLAQRPEYGIHFDEPSIINSKEHVEVNNGNNNRNNKNTDGNNKKISVKDKGKGKDKIKNVDKTNLGKSNKFKRVIRISRKEYERRNELKQQLRDKILHHNNIEVQN